MSALAMILTAAMVVPADGRGPEKVSAEIVQEERLDLSGKWKGWQINSRGPTHVEMTFKSWGVDVIDEGAGRMRYKGRSGTWYGIYEQHGDRLMICLAFPGNPRPVHPERGNGHLLLILHRAKSSK